MKTKVLTQVVVIFLIAAISCTKDSSNVPSSIAPVSQQSSDLLTESLDNEENSLPVAGKWTLHFDWFCDGVTGSAIMIVNPDGSWRMPHHNYTGSWVKGRGIFLFTFDQAVTTYSGVICNNKIKGIMTSWDGIQGCFYLEPYEANNSKQEEHTSETRDASGKKQ